ncbi:MAG: hypothetical protein CL927_18690 [Deltaproteobacteria bacterium]|nr:hypothetical protein [Deltaproteobacteria bacterium]HCH62164.1 hypothetical protein [Deltaproteobacteria bacterium]
MPTLADPYTTRHTGRFSLDARSMKHLWRRQLRWTAGFTIASATLTIPPPLMLPEVGMLPIGLACIVAFPVTWKRGLGLAFAGFTAALVAGIWSPGLSTIGALLAGVRPNASGLSAAQVVVGMLATGALLPSVERPSPHLLHRVEAALGLLTCAGIGAFVAESIVSTAWLPMARAGVTGVVMGGVSSLSLGILAIRHRVISRVPDRETIAAALDARHRGPALLAWQLDARLQHISPDRNTRDGLREVAAWVFRLQWTQQNLAREEDRMGSLVLEARILDLTERAASEQDAFTRDRLRASVQHLQRIQEHRKGLAFERGRAAALAEFATAFLEEACSGLTLAGVQAVGPTAARLPEVLERLRAYSDHRDAARRTQRELVQLVG